MPGRRCTGLVLALVIAATARADDGLETKALRAAAIGCQKAISKAHEAAARARIAALERCSGDALKCIQSEEPNEACLEKAAATCAARLVKAASALDKLAGKIVANKNCSRRLRLVDLLRPEGLGFGRLIGACVADSGLDACTGLRPLADCIVRSSDRIAAGAYGRGAPRSSELIDLLRGHAAPRPVPTVDGLPHFPGCGPCAVVQVERKALGACGRTIRRSFVKLLATWEKHLATCARKAFACAQAGTNAARCRRKAEAACTTALSPRLARALTTFRTTVTEKQCALAAIDYARIVGQQGLNFAALADECAALGIPDLAAASTPEVLARCLEARSRCLVAERLRSSLPRAEDLAAAGLLGAEAGAAIAETCPTEAGPGVPTVRAATFGSLLKLVKAIRRGNLNAARSRGVPAPRRFAPRRVRAPRGMRFGSITKIPVRLTYDLGGTPVNRRHTAVLDAPPQLIVSLLGGDGEPDHFAVDLDPPPPTQNEVEIEIELEEGITTCAFTLGFATRQDGEVSAYTPLLFVRDPEAPPLATSTPATPTPTASSTPTRSATPTPTLSPTPTVTATPHSAILRLFNVDDAVSAFLNDHGASAVGATFQQDRSFDVSPQLACGENRLTVRVTNGGGPYTYGAELSVDGFQRVSSTCGTVASGGGVSIGCNDGDTTEGLVAVEHAYFCLDCGTGCASQGTCASPYQVPAARFARVKTNLGGTSARTSGCGTSAGPEKIFRWIPPTSGCYAISTCGSGPFTTVLDVRAGDCGTGGSCGSPAGCAGHRTFTGQFAAQTAYFISVDSPSTASTGGALTLTIRPSSFCVD